jgi:hypothetical protein
LILTLFPGSAAQAAVLVGLGTFGSSFLMGLSYFDSETEASSMFGLLVSVAGIVGTPLGGMLVDATTQGGKGDSSSCSVGSNSVSVTASVPLSSSSLSPLSPPLSPSSVEAGSVFDTSDGNTRAIRTESTPVPPVDGDNTKCHGAEGDHALTDKKDDGRTANARTINSLTNMDPSRTATECTNSGGKDSHHHRLQQQENESEKQQNAEANCHAEDNKYFIIRTTSTLVAASSALGTSCLVLVYFVHPKALFLLLMTVGCMFIFLCNPAINIGVMTSVPEGNKSFAIALMSIL